MIELKNISFGVDDDKGKKEIIRDVSFTVPDGKLIVITGPNGGGKSTLARLIAGIEKPLSGKILLDGEDITDMSITERAKKGIGFAFQQPVRFKGIEVFDLIRLATGKSISISDACSYLSAVGLCARDYIKREVNSSLSGGELKRIEIATVLARSPRISVFDEPEAGIDLWSFKNLIEVFEGMRKHIKESSILIISHQERILNIADEIMVIKEGRLINKGTRDELMPQLMSTDSAVRDCNGVGEKAVDITPEPCSTSALI
jgi:Fe-S cluster assembly ATP-binding protein